MIFPSIYNWKFWDSKEGFPTHADFFIIPMKNSEEIASMGYWDGTDLVWLAEYYHASGNGMVYYIKDEETGSVEEAEKEVWIDFVSKNYKECFDWILFRIPEINIF